MNFKLALVAFVLFGAFLFGCTASGQVSGAATPAPLGSGYQSADAPIDDMGNASADTTDFNLGDVDDSNLDYTG